MPRGCYRAFGLTYGQSTICPDADKAIRIVSIADYSDYSDVAIESLSPNAYFGMVADSELRFARVFRR
jgi:hypothetical protein